MSAGATMSDTQRLTAALERIKLWMVENKAKRLVKNLAPGAADEALAKAEAQLGFPLSAELRALWSLHGGQKEEGNSFFEHRDFLDLQRALGERDHLELSVQHLRENADERAAAKIDEAELRSDHWVPFAAQDSDQLAVCTDSGRVFQCDADSPPLKLFAGSLSQYAEEYAARLEAGDYRVENDGGMCSLELRDRKQEAFDAQYAREKEEKERYRRETPLLVQVQDALAGSAPERCQELFEQIAKTEPPRRAGPGGGVSLRRTGEAPGAGHRPAGGDQ
jgi:cell wall assembly regulator SMI1